MNHKSRSAAYNRDVSRRKALRKRKITREIYHTWYPWGGKDYYDNLHQFSKNKIHCSCPMCSAKTRNKGRRNRANYARSINYKWSELKRQISMDEEEMEYLGTTKSNRRKTDW